MYCKAKNITEEADKASALLQHIGSEMLEKIIDWAYPVDAATMKFEDLMKLVEDKNSIQANLFSMRIKFFNEKQKSGQSVDEYFRHMSQLLGQCKVSSMTHEELGVMAVLQGLDDEELRRYLMTPTHEIKTMDQARGLAMSFEKTRAASNYIKNNERPKPFSVNVAGNGYRCKFCGGSHPDTLI